MKILHTINSDIKITSEFIKDLVVKALSWLANAALTIIIAPFVIVYRVVESIARVILWTMTTISNTITSSMKKIYQISFSGTNSNMRKPSNIKRTKQPLTPQGLQNITEKKQGLKNRVNKQVQEINGKHDEILRNSSTTYTTAQEYIGSLRVIPDEPGEGIASDLYKTYLPLMKSLVEEKWTSITPYLKEITIICLHKLGKALETTHTHMERKINDASNDGNRRKTAKSLKAKYKNTEDIMEKALKYLNNQATSDSDAKDMLAELRAKLEIGEALAHKLTLEDGSLEYSSGNSTASSTEYSELSHESSIGQTGPTSFWR